MKKTFLILLFFMIFTSIAIAQEKKIYVFGEAVTGFNLYKKESGELICFAQVDAEGKFKCKANPDVILSEEKFFKIIAEALVKALKDIEIEAEPVWEDLKKKSVVE